MDLRSVLAPALEPAVDLPLLFHLAQDKLPAALGFQAGQLWVQDPQRSRMMGPRDVGLDVPDGFSDELLKEGLGLIDPVWIGRRAPGSPLARVFTEDVQSWLVAPIRRERTTLGLLVMVAKAPMTSDPSGAARDVVDLLIDPITRAQGRSAALEDLVLHQLLLDLVRQLSGAFPMTAFLQHLFRGIERLVPVDAMFVAAKRPDGAFEALFETDVDDRGERMFFPVPHAMEPSRAKQLEAVDAHDYLLILRTEEELRRLQDTDRNPHGFGNARRRSRSLLYVPLWANDAFAGLLSVQSYRANAYAHADARRVLQVADYVGLALRLSRPRAV